MPEINLADTAPVGVCVWLGTADNLTRLKGPLDNAVVFTHRAGAAPGDWSYAASQEIDPLLLMSLADVIKQYATARLKVAATPAPAPQAAPAPGEKVGNQKKISFPLPPGTTKEQADTLVDQMRGQLGMQARVPPKPGEAPL